MCKVHCPACGQLPAAVRQREIHTAGQLSGSEVLAVCSFGADVWDEDPPSASHPWRLLPRSATTPHMAGLTIDAQVHVETRWLLQL